MKIKTQSIRLNPWAYIEGYEGKYGVSIFGRVCSYQEPFNPKSKVKQLAMTEHKDGNLYVTLHKDGKRKRHYVHRLVAETFKANPRNFKCVRHIDGNKKNNHVVNLEWANHSILHRKLKPTQLPPTQCKSFVKDLKRLHGREIREMKTQGMSVAELMRKFNASRYQIEVCLYGTVAEQAELKYWRNAQKWYGEDTVDKYLICDLLEYHERETNSWKWKRDQEYLEEMWKEEYGDDWRSIVLTPSEEAKANCERLLAKASAELERKIEEGYGFDDNDFDYIDFDDEY